MIPAVIKPFCATCYNPSRIKNYSRVICPPYDVISKKQSAVLRNKSPYNFSRILIADKNDYRQKGLLLDKWIKERILIDDSQESFYLYEQKYSFQGKPSTRFGILSLLQMDKKGIFSHENTFSAPKRDRAKIIKAVKANLSPIFIIAAGKLKALESAYKTYSRKKPFFRFKDSDNNPSRVWRISDREDIARLSRALSKCKLVIADGHHRFEITYDYFRKNRGKFKDLNYVLAYVTDCQEGLNIMPTHRIVPVKGSAADFFTSLSKYFRIETVGQAELKAKLKDNRGFNLGICKAGRFYFLRLKDRAVLDKLSNMLYRELDTYLFHQLVLPLLDVSGPMDYAHSLEDAKRLAAKDKVAFILRPASLKSVLKISSAGFKLPQKSTYFYPKVASGVTLRRFKRLKT